MGESLFGTETPSSPDVSDGGTPLTLGTYIIPNVAGTVTHARWRFPNTTPDASIPVVHGIYRLSDSLLLGSVAFPIATPVGQWNTAAYSTPIALEAGVHYALALWTPNRYVASNFYTYPKTTANTTTESTSAGRYTSPSSSGLLLPTSSYQSSCYFVDMIFEPAGSPPAGPTVKLWNGTAEVAVTTTLWNGTSEVAVSLSSIT